MPDRLSDILALCMDNSKLLGIIVPRLAGAVPFTAWINFAASCTATLDATRAHTQYDVTLDGTQVRLFRWGSGFGAQPRLYLTLAMPNVSRSFKWKGNTTGETWWGKIRFDPATFMVHTGDYTFARLGRHSHRLPDANTLGREALVPDLGTSAPPMRVNVGEHTPFATCFDCSAVHSHRALSVVDLRGTPFAVASGFAHGGYCSAGALEAHARFVNPFAARRDAPLDVPEQGVLVAWCSYAPSAWQETGGSRTRTSASTFLAAATAAGLRAPTFQRRSIPTTTPERGRSSSSSRRPARSRKRRCSALPARHGRPTGRLTRKTRRHRRGKRRPRLRTTRIG